MIMLVSTSLILNLLFLLKNLHACVIIGTDQLEQNLCRKKICPNYSRCKVDEKKLFTQCVCSNECDERDIESMLPEYLKNSNVRRDEVVCGSDGESYENACQLRKLSCEQNKEIKIMYIGKCGKYYLLILACCNY